MATKRSRPSSSTHSTPKNRIVMEDLAEGKEIFPIQVINNHTDEVPSFNYIQNNSFTEDVIHQTKSEVGDFLPPQGCSCEYNYNTQTCGLDCECHGNSVVLFDPKNRIIEDPMSLDFYTDFYVECGTHCGCQGKCNRKIFNGPSALKKLHVEYFPKKKFGVVVDQPVAIGMPVCEYRGLVCIRDANYMESSHYEEDLFFDNTGKHYILDAVEHGNVARFINHSCSANLVQVCVYPSIPTQRKIPPVPRVVLVASRDIRPGTELTFNYGAAYFHDRNLRCYCYELCCLIPPYDWALHVKSQDRNHRDIEFDKYYMTKNFKNAGDVKREVIELDSD